MAYKKVGFDFLNSFLPVGSFDWVMDYLKKYKIDLKITPERQSKLGDYMYHREEKRHKISINGTLNQYEFFFTFVHELAHLITFVDHQYRVEAHGVEWKSNFKELLRTCIHVFPENLQKVIEKHIKNMKSAQCHDAQLFLEFKKFDAEKKYYVNDLLPDDLFQIKSGDIFRVINKRRTRFLCENISTRKQYLFPKLYEIIPISND